MLLHYFLGKLEAKLSLMPKYEENIQGQKFVLLDRTCENENLSKSCLCLCLRLLYGDNIKGDNQFRQNLQE